MRIVNSPSRQRKFFGGLLLSIGIFLAVCWSVLGTAEAQQATPVTAFEGARLITGDGGAPITDAVFIVANGQFTAVGQREAIVHALTESKGRVGGPDGAAARLGINRTTLLARMKKFGLDRRQYA
jgi:DNA-binding NtrC family response regulator